VSRGASRVTEGGPADSIAIQYRTKEALVRLARATFPAAFVHDCIRSPSDASLSELFEIPALVPAPGGGIVEAADGSCRMVALDEARALFRAGEVLVAHGAFVAGRLKTAPQGPLFDLLELFAFVRPGVPFVPSPVGLARALGLEIPRSAEEQAQILRKAAKILLEELRAQPEAFRLRRARIGGAARTIGLALGRISTSYDGRTGKIVVADCRPRSVARAAANGKTKRRPPSRARCRWRSAKRARVRAIVAMRARRARAGRPMRSGGLCVRTARARGRAQGGADRSGHGHRQDAGLSRARSLWAEKNGPGLWISTYTRNLQRQIVQELARLYPDPAEREEKAVVRKGRENYLCLLNFEDAAKRTRSRPGQRTVALGLIARWIAATSDGDISGAGFPAFLAASFPVREKSPTGAANASMPRVRIIAPVSSNAR
jgi:ATP-dependent DNA helicase DinG